MDDNNFTGFGYGWQNKPEENNEEPEVAEQAQEEAQPAQEQPAAEYQAAEQVYQQPAPQPQPLPYQPYNAAPQPVPQPYQPYPQPYAQPQPAQPYAAPPARKKTGLYIFLVLLVLVAFIGIGIIGGAVFRYAQDGRPAVVDQEKPTKANADDSKLDIAATPEGDSSVAAVAGGLTPVQIHQKLKNANVAVQIYSSRGGESAVGEGSGIIIHEDSTKTYTYVVTCAHVISDGSSVSIELEDGTRYDAEIVGADTRTDVGLMRVKKTGLNGAEFGDSEQLKVGEPVYAIGNPGGIQYKGSFTSGMVSAMERPIESNYKMLSIQHTAAINPGNSGGALVNAHGQVIGINSQKIVDTHYEGMGFAIPSKIVKEVVDNLIAKGYVPNRPKLGIEYLVASTNRTGYFVLRANNLPSGSLIIATIDPESVLAGTDVQPNDIITHVDGEPLNKTELLPETIENSKVGDKLTLTIARVNPQDYTVRTFDVEVELMEDKGTASEPKTQPWYYDQGNFEDFFGW